MSTKQYRAVWSGSITKCDICKLPIETKFVDGKTTSGPWAIMCPVCFTLHGVGLGTGLGQRYEKHQNNHEEKAVFVKVEG